MRECKGFHEYQSVKVFANLGQCNIGSYLIEEVQSTFIMMLLSDCRTSKVKENPQVLMMVRNSCGP